MTCKFSLEDLVLKDACPSSTVVFTAGRKETVPHARSDGISRRSAGLGEVERQVGGWRNYF